MRHFVAALVVLACAEIVAADQPARPPSDVTAAIDRGLSFLAKDAVAWKQAHNCVSCHHAGLVVWAMNEAKLRGMAVDEPLRKELTQWVATSGDENGGAQKRPESAPHSLNTKALYYALTLVSDPQLDAAAEAGLKHILEIVIGDQTENGSWQTWPESRPPIIGPTDEKMTLLAALALLPAAASGDERAKAAHDKAVAWLTTTKSDDDPQSSALRLILWRRLDRPRTEWEPLARAIEKRQNADGGWSQTPEMASDAWATGQALYALVQAEVKPDDPAIERGRAFLMDTQREDGSWLMVSRPSKPDGPGSKSLIPIIGAGSAWAVIGLVRSR
jgi:prenyltransferase beta subunit